MIDCFQYIDCRSVENKDSMKWSTHTPIPREIRVPDLNEEARNNVWGNPLIALIQVSILSCPWARQLSQDVRADADFLCDRASALGNTIKESRVYKEIRLEAVIWRTHHRSHLQWANRILRDIEWFGLHITGQLYVQHAIVFRRVRSRRT